MKKEFTPIAMKCNKEQFEAIKPKLENFEKEIGGFGGLPYLTNFLRGIENNIRNIFESCKGDYNREVHEEWNEKVFLQACGIETEQEYKITKSQLLKLKDGYKTEKLREWFPEAFETVLPKDFTGWAKNKKYTGWLGYYKEGDLKYGISDDEQNNDWFVSTGAYYEDDMQATESEVSEALKNEAVKRRFGKKVYVKDCGDTEDGEFSYHSRYNYLYCGKYAIFKDGIWVEIITTLTRKEAENKLGVKIVD